MDARVTAAIARGKRPDPSRTRKLRPAAPMVLHPGGCGRVGHRRNTIQVEDPNHQVGVLPHLTTNYANAVGRPVSVHPMREADLNSADEICRAAFGAFLGVPDVF